MFLYLTSCNVIQQRVKFKVATLIHQVLARHAPSYLPDGGAALSPAPTPEDCSADTRMLLISQTWTSLGDRAFWLLDLESETICQWASDSQTSEWDNNLNCLIAVCKCCYLLILLTLKLEFLKIKKAYAIVHYLCHLCSYITH